MSAPAAMARTTPSTVPTPSAIAFISMQSVMTSPS